MMKKLVKLIRIVLAAAFVYAWYKGMRAFIQFHYACCPELYATSMNKASFYVLMLMMALLLTGALDIPLHFLRDGLIDLLAPISGWTLDLLTAIHR